MIIREVRSVMTREVVTVTEQAPFTEMVRWDDDRPEPARVRSWVP